MTLTVDLDSQEKHYKRVIEQLKLDHEQEVFKLKQENFVLSAKVSKTSSHSCIKHTRINHLVKYVHQLVFMY